MSAIVDEQDKHIHTNKEIVIHLSPSSWTFNSPISAHGGVELMRQAKSSLMVLKSNSFTDSLPIVSNTIVSNTIVSIHSLH